MIGARRGGARLDGNEVAWLSLPELNLALPDMRALSHGLGMDCWPPPALGLCTTAHSGWLSMGMLGNILEERRKRRRLPFDVYKAQHAKAHVIIAGLTHTGFTGNGKVEPKEFFPEFCKRLAEYGVTTYFCSTEKQIQKYAKGAICIINIINEVEKYEVRCYPDLKKYGVRIFNEWKMCDIIGDKIESNKFLTDNAILMPKLDVQTGLVFSNEIRSSAANVVVINAEEALEGRYNTEFIDTRISYQCVEYYTCLRLMCLNGTLLDTLVRALPVEMGPNVRARNMPVDAAMMRFMQEHLVTRNLAALGDLARRVADILGDGFYAHDVLVERETNRILIAEPGWKIHDFTFSRHFHAIRHLLPDNKLLDGDYQRHVADVLVRELGWPQELAPSA